MEPFVGKPTALVSNPPVVHRHRIFRLPVTRLKVKHAYTPPSRPPPIQLHLLRLPRRTCTTTQSPLPPPSTQNIWLRQHHRPSTIASPSSPWPLPLPLQRQEAAQTRHAQIPVENGECRGLVTDSCPSTHILPPHPQNYFAFHHSTQYAIYFPASFITFAALHSWRWGHHPIRTPLIVLLGQDARTVLRKHFVAHHMRPPSPDPLLSQPHGTPADRCPPHRQIPASTCLPMPSPGAMAVLPKAATRETNFCSSTTRRGKVKISGMACQAYTSAAGNPTSRMALRTLPGAEEMTLAERLKAGWTSVGIETEAHSH